MAILSNLQSGVVFTFTLWLLWYIISGIFSYRRLKHIPGPPLAACTSLWWMRAATSRYAHLVLEDVCLRYGPIARIGPNTVLTNDGDLFRKANVSRGSNYSRGNWYKAFKLDGKRENLFTEINEEKHAKMRQKVAMGYSGKDNPELEPSIDQIMLNLVKLIQSKYLSVDGDIRAMDLATVAQYFTLDIITYLSLGKPFGYVSEDTDKYAFMETMEKNMPVMTIFSAAPILSSIMRIPFIQNELIPDAKEKIGVGRVKMVSRGIIAQRFKDEKSERHDMVLSFKKQGMTQEEIADESLLQLFAGSDTTASTLRTGLLSIISNPNVYRKLRAEIASISDSIPLTSVISNVRSFQLPYLQACIKECLRHHPAVTGLLPRVVGSEGDTHKGVYLPPGTEVGFCIWQLQRNNIRIYGPDAGIFRPERWLEAETTQLAAMEEQLRLSLGYGRFRCLGENIARIEMNKFFFEMMRRFEWAVCDPVTPMTQNKNYGLFYQKGLWVRISKLEEW